MRIDFRILGPLEVGEGEQRLPLGGQRQRALLALLLLHANEVVSRDRLIDEVWGEEPPATVDNAVQVYVSRLRKLLQSGNGGGSLSREGNGYLLTIEPEQLDATRFQQLVRDGRRARAEGDNERAAVALCRALELWRGSALADVALGEFAHTEIARLEELRLTALEDRIEADLARGRDVDLVPELEALVAEQPYRERLRASLMLALYRSGRQADALDAYARTRTALDELGLEPGEELRRLQTQILQHDPSLDRPLPAGRLKSPHSAESRTRPARGRADRHADRPRSSAPCLRGFRAGQHDRVGGERAEELPGRDRPGDEPTWFPQLRSTRDRGG